MDDFGSVLAFLFVVAGFVMGIVALVKARGLGRRLAQVEAILGAVQANLASARIGPVPQTARATEAALPPQAAPLGETPLPPLLPDAAPAPAEAGTALPGGAWSVAPPAAPTEPVAPAPLPPLVPAAASVAGGGTRGGLELKLGGGLFVWIGGIALALSALFLVRYAIDQGYLSPVVRVILAALFGAGLIAGAEWLRTRDDRIAQALAAAGVAALFGALLAGVALYELIPRLAGGIMALALTAAAISLSLRHGVFVAAVGLMAGVITPILIGSDNPNTFLLFAYLLAISAGTLAVIRHRGWWWLGWGVLAGDTLWSLGWLLMRAFASSKYRDEQIWVGLFQVAVAGLFVWATWRRLREQSETLTHVAVKVAVAMVITGVLIVFTIADYERQVAGWFTLLLHAAAIYALARYVPRYQWLAVVPPLLSLLAFLIWRGPNWLDTTFSEADDFARTICVVGGLLAAGALALAWNAGRPGFWAALSAATAFLHLVVAYGALRNSMTDTMWGGLSLVLALPYLVASERFGRWRGSMNGANEALGFAAVGVCFFIAAAVPLELKEQWITVAYAIALPMVAWIALKLELRILRWLCWGIVVAVTVRLVLNPSVAEYPLGSLPFVNWILYTYGIAAGAFWLANRFLVQQRRDTLTLAIEACVAVFVLLLVTLEIRSLFAGSKMVTERIEFFERATYVAAWGTLALVVMVLDSFSPSVVRTWAWRILGAGTLFVAVVVQALFLNPVFIGGNVGSTPIVNGLLLAYALPAVLAGVAAWRLAASTDRIARSVAAAGALFLAFVWLTSEIRHVFHPKFGGDPFAAVGGELYTYSVAWLAFGAAVLGYGLWRNLAAARHAGMAVVLLAVCKAFLIDMAGLEDLWRVFSFMGLGAVLLGLGYVYRQIAFKTAPAAPPSAKAG